MYRLRLFLNLLAISTLLVAACAPAAAPGPTVAPPRPETQAETKTARSEPASPATTPKPTAEEPKYGGILAVSNHGDPSHFDLHQESSYQMQALLQVAYSGVTQFDPDSPEEVIGDLAKSWDVSKDGLTYTFQLNKDIRFHDGSLLTSEDVKTSFDRQVNPPKGIRSLRRPVLELIERIEAPERDVVKFTLRYPYSPFLGVISSGWMAVYSKAFVEKKGDMRFDIMGAGPYKLKRYTSGSALEYVKHPDFFVKGRPYLDGITFYIIQDAATRLAAFRTGRVQVTAATPGGLSPTQADMLRKTMPQAVLQEYSPLSRAEYLVQTERKPWNDVRVRKAAELAIDRHKAIQVLEQGFAELGSNMPGKWGIPREELLTMPGWRLSKEADIAEAKRLLAEAGYPAGFQTKVSLRAEKTQEDLATFLADQLGQIGIKLQLQPVDRAIQVQLQISGAYEMYVRSTTLSLSDPQDLIRYWGPPVDGDWSMNLSRLVDKDVVDLFDRQSKALDPAERMKIVRQLDLKISELAAEPILYWRKGIIGMWPQVKGRGKVVSCFNLNKYEGVWLAK